MEIENDKEIDSDAEGFSKKHGIVDANTMLGEAVLREKEVDASDIIKAIRMQRMRNITSTDEYVKIPLERMDQIIVIIENACSIYDSIKDEAILRFGSNDTLAMKSSKAYNNILDTCNILKELRMVTLQQAFQKLT